MAVADTLRLAIAQLNPTVGDLDSNVALALDALGTATDGGADVVVLPEMMITGYPPEDLVFKPGFLADVRAALEKFAAGSGRTAAVIGFADGGDPTVADHDSRAGVAGSLRRDPPG